MKSLVDLPRELFLETDRRRTPGSVIGVDGGATKTLAAAWNPDLRSLTLGTAGPSNPDAVGVTAAIEAVRDAVARALPHRASIACAVFGLAGTDTAALKEIIDRAFAATRSYTVNDSVLAWASSTNGAPGIGVIAGTGSNVLGVGRSGVTWRAGGWGHVLGDEGSAWWIGREGLKAALHHRDGTGPPTALYEDAPGHFGVDSVEDVAVLAYGKPLTKGEIASFSRRVSERAAEGDAVAISLLVDAGRDLARQVRAVILRTGLNDGKPFVCGKVGSTWNAGPPLTETFEREVGQLVPSAEFTTISAPPVYGAVVLAGKAAGLWDEGPPALLRRQLEEGDKR